MVLVSVYYLRNDGSFTMLRAGHNKTDLCAMMCHNKTQKASHENNTEPSKQQTIKQNKTKTIKDLFRKDYLEKYFFLSKYILNS